MARVIILLISIIYLASCSQNEVATNIKEPVILIAGYGNGADIWEKEGFTSFLKNKDSLIYGGVWNILRCRNDSINIKIADTFSVAFSDSTGNIDKLADELTEIIDFITQKTGANKVVLIGYSMGGLIARRYLVQTENNHKVKALVTIATPHKGSYLANVLYGGELILGGTESVIVNIMSSLLNRPIKGEAISQMIQSGKESFLVKMNNKTHPTDIQYHSIIAQSTLSSKLKWIYKKTGIATYDGDYVVSCQSQSMSNVAGIKVKVSEKLVKNANHFNILSKHEEIFDIIKLYLEK